MDVRANSSTPAIPAKHAKRIAALYNSVAVWELAGRAVLDGKSTCAPFEQCERYVHESVRALHAEYGIVVIGYADVIARAAA